MSVPGSGAAIANFVQHDVPTTFDGWELIGNEARASGGVLESGAGLDSIISTVFKGNSAPVGGAVRLGRRGHGTFCHNTSDGDDGSAVSNIGYISSMSKVSSVDNGFKCEPERFLDYSLVSFF